MNWAEYLAHESGDLVPRAQAEQFLVEVDDLRERVDRLQARFLQLAVKADTVQDRPE
jgi:ubiquinone biosynthesis protein UbiJ